VAFWKKGLRFVGSVLGWVEFGAVDEDDPARHTLMEHDNCGKTRGERAAVKTQDA